MVGIMIVLGGRYNHNQGSRTKQIIALVVLIGAGIAVFVMISKFNENSDLTIKNKQLTISRSYGPVDSVNEVVLVQSLPKTLSRKNC